MLYEDLTKSIIGCAMEVHKRLRNGFQEVIYQRALEIEMKEAGLKFERELSMPIFYKGRRIGERRADFFVEEKILVEIKAISALTKADEAQIINYLKATGKRVGLLLNFGKESLEYRRFVL